MRPPDKKAEPHRYCRQALVTDYDPPAELSGTRACFVVLPGTPHDTAWAAAKLNTVGPPEARQ